MKALTALIASALLLAGPVAAEPRFSAMVSDVATARILTADRIDAPRDTALLGRLATTILAIEDVEKGQVSRDDRVAIGTSHEQTFSQALENSALGEAGWRAAFTGLVNKIGRNASLFSQRLEARFETAGLQATRLQIVRAADGGPDFEGYTTMRDLSRFAIAAIRAWPERIKHVYGPATGHIESTGMWLYEDGECLLWATGPLSGRDLLVALSGAPDAENCLMVAARLVREADDRYEAASESR